MLCWNLASSARKWWFDLHSHSHSPMLFAASTTFLSATKICTNTHGSTQRMPGHASLTPGSPRLRLYSVPKPWHSTLRQISVTLSSQMLRKKQKQFQRTAAFSLTTETYPASYSSIQSAILSLGDKRPYFIIEHAKLKLLNHWCKVWLYSQLINWPACCPRRRIQKWRKRTSDTIESFPLKGSNGSNKAPRVITHSHMTNRMFQQTKISRLWWRFSAKLLKVPWLMLQVSSAECRADSASQFVKIECFCNIFPCSFKNIWAGAKCFWTLKKIWYLKDSADKFETSIWICFIWRRMVLTSEHYCSW
jgi:hypothetical protein